MKIIAPDRRLILPPAPRFRVGGIFDFVCRGPDGRVKWRATAKNGVVNVGLDHILTTVFAGGTPVDPWYISLIDNASYSALAAADTMSSHAGWIENEDYDEANRVTWADDATSSQQKTNSTSADFTMNATKTIKGAFMTSVNTKGGTTGTLFCTALFTEGDRSVVSADTIEVTYTLTAQDDTA